MYKYLAFLSVFIQNENKNLWNKLFKKINKRNNYTLIDAEKDANNIYDHYQYQLKELNSI